MCPPSSPRPHDNVEDRANRLCPKASSVRCQVGSPRAQPPPCGPGPAEHDARRPGPTRPVVDSRAACSPGRVSRDPWMGCGTAGELCLLRCGFVNDRMPTEWAWRAGGRNRTLRPWFWRPCHLPEAHRQFSESLFGGRLNRKSRPFRFPEGRLPCHDAGYVMAGSLCCSAAVPGTR
jgi:hypothetical protein